MKVAKKPKQVRVNATGVNEATLLWLADCILEIIKKGFRVYVTVQQTTNVNLYHVTKFSFYLSFTVNSISTLLSLD